MNPRMIILAGPNGAGKTTAAMRILKPLWQCPEYINADKIAEGLSPLHGESMDIHAGKIMLGRIQECLRKRLSFAFETTLASLSFLQTIDQAHGFGYTVHMLFFWLPSPEAAYQRVRQRVLAGGHDIPREVIQRRYHRGIQNFQKYTEKVDSWTLLDHTLLKPKIIAQKIPDQPLKTMDETLWTLFQKTL